MMLEADGITPGLRAPFPWFGGKTLAAPLIWQTLGDVPNFVEPFAGSLAVLLGRPHAATLETVNDKDCLIANAWRAIKADPAAVAQWCDQPVNEADQHAVHTWLLGQIDTLASRIMGDHEYYDAQIAGRWIWGLCCWIGGGWCSGDGPWQSVDGQFVNTGGNGVRKKLVHLRNAGMGVHRQRVHLGDAGRGVHRQRVHLGDAGRGVHRQLVHLGDAGQGSAGLYDWFRALQARLRYVRVCCGDWQRVLGPSVTFKRGLTGILFDPPYSAEEGRDPRLYYEDDLQIAHRVREWCVEHGANPLLRIVLCGYEPIHDALLASGWTKRHWRANGGMANHGRKQTNANKYRETLWCSPACLSTTALPQLTLFPIEA